MAGKTLLLVLLVCLLAMTPPSMCLAQADAPLPAGVRAVWDLDKAWRQKTPTRERVCLNGLWRWQPAQKDVNTVPAGNWGWLKVPGTWPGIDGDYMWRQSQTTYLNPSWAKSDFRNLTSAWHQREFTVPRDWAGRRITVSLEYLYTAAAVYVDGKKMGETFFPAGEVDITAACRPGEKQVLSILAAAAPLGEETTYFAAAQGAFKSKATVRLRALCGDVYLSATPAGARLADVKIDTSVRKWSIAIDAAVAAAAAGGKYTLRGVVTDGMQTVKELSSAPFTAADLAAGRFKFAADWKPDKLWDLNTPGNMYELQLSLLDGKGTVLDTFQPVRFGFREFWIDGRDFFLNGSRIWCFAEPLDSAQVSAASATYDGARESMRRLKSIGVNLVYTHNYGTEPGTHLSFAEILRAADDEGMLVSFSQPHASAYNWKAADADDTNGYARHAEFFVRVAQNHPAVVMYSMNHNMCGYYDENNPDHIDGQRDLTGNIGVPDDGNARLALRTEAIVKRFDTSRVIYHHSSGNLSQMYTLNIYLNHVPAQERSEWFEHWSKEGVKPLFLCEYGNPIDLDWTNFRGYFKGERTWGNSPITWEMCFAEWGAQYRGDKAYDLIDKEKADLRFEAKKWQAGGVWYRWDYPSPITEYTMDTPNILEPLATYIPDNWRAYRAWGISAFNCWEIERMWSLRPGFTPQPKTFKVDWDKLQQPGYSPDVLDRQFEAFEYSYEPADWVPAAPMQALIRNNQPILACIVGKADHFTSKDHNFLPGQRVEKQILLINNSRQTIDFKSNWSISLSKGQAGVNVLGGDVITVKTGEMNRHAINIDLPSDVDPGVYPLELTTTCNNGQKQTDTLAINVLPAPTAAKLAAPPGPTSKIALFDPKGETAILLQTVGILFQKVDATANLDNYDVLIIGKSALGVDGPGPDISRVRDGLKVLVFEQSADVMEKRLGLRVEEYGLRWVFPRRPDHPALAGLTPDLLRDWRGEATILPPRLVYRFDKYKAPTVQWCGIDVPHAWRCGNWGNVASVLIEKPQRGDWMPIVDGGFSLQYSPLLEYREGKGLVLFCQMDVTGRTDSDPAAQILARNAIDYVRAFKPGAVGRKAVYAGDPAGKAYLEKVGFTVDAYNGKLAADQVLIVGPGSPGAGGKTVAGNPLAAGGHVLAIGLDDQELNAFLPFKVTTKTAEHISVSFDPPKGQSLLAGVSPADLMSRPPMKMPLITGGADAVGDGVLAQAKDASVVFLQLKPWDYDSKQYNFKRTYRRTSFATMRLLANLGVAAPTPLLARFKTPPDAAKGEKRWLDGLYVDVPEEMDDPYRCFGW